MIRTRLALARLLVLLAIKLIPVPDLVYGASFGALSRLYQANDRLRFRLGELVTKGVGHE